MSNKKSHYGKAGLVFEEMEPKLLLSADPLAVAAEADVSAVQERLVDNDEVSPAIVQSEVEQSSASVRDELVIIDSRAPNYQQLYNDLIKSQQQGRNIHVVVLDAHRDGIEQISEALMSHDRLDAVHIVSHGDDAQLQLGSTQLDKTTLRERSTEISQWKDRFSEEGDVLIYGCNFAETAEGRKLINALGYLTATDVAASDDLTGHRLLGGDWELEYEAGDIETDVAFSTPLQDSWQGTLDAAAQAGAEEQQAAEELQQQEQQAQIAYAEQQAALKDGEQTEPLEAEQQEAEQQEAIVEEQRQELVFVDESVGDYLSFIDDLQANSDQSTTFEIVLLDGQSSGIDQINESLSAYTDVDALHLVTHGSDGSLKLGNAWLNINTIEDSRESLAAWGSSLDLDADILIYGCNLAETADGQNFVAELAQITGTDVAVSTDITGHALFGGDWDLEYKVGMIETSVAFSEDLQESWISMLNTYAVTSTADSGPGSLRQAILDANANAGVTDTITFNFAGAGPHVINLTAPLPTITDTVIIDGTTEPDYTGDPVVRIDGASAGAGVNGLTFGAGSDESVVRGFMITNFTGYGIQINAGADSIRIVNNWIGTTGTGSTGVGNGNSGINIQGANTVVGGSGINDGNVITNNGNEGINVTGAGATGTVIQGNIIGLDPDGATGSGNADVGIALLGGAHNTTIGGAVAAERNVISNNFEGIEINSNNNVVQGNYVGTDISGTLDRGNRSDDGVEIQNNASGNLIGGTEPGAGNLIAFNARDGVYIVSGTGNAVLGNRIHSNTGLAIDLGTNGVNVNDANDVDAGANDLQNFPVLTSALTNGTNTIAIEGSLNSTASTDFRIEFFASTVADASGNGEAERYLGSATVSTDAGGNATFSIRLTEAVANGEFITATATLDNGGGSYGSTSELAQNVTAALTNFAPELHDWYDSNWDYRKSITIDAAGVNSNLTDFPVLVSLIADADLAANAQADGDDILFTSADGTKLAHEIESYDSATGALTAWVKTDLSALADTTLFMYYGNAGAANQQDAANVWDASYMGVWHLNDIPTGAPGDINDSTANNNDGTTEGAMDAADSVSAKIGTGLDFDEVDDLIRMQDSASLDSVNDEATFELWVWFDNAADGDHQFIMSSSNRFSGGDGYEWASQGSGNHFFYPDATTPDGNFNLGPNPFTDQQWHHLAVTMDYASRDVDIYVDGMAMDFTTEGVPTRWTALTSSNDWLWGGNPDRATRYFDGIMDEIRVSDVVRSQAWIQTSINNQSDPSTFFTLGAAESRDLTLAAVNENDTNPAGDTVTAILASGSGDRITDVDAGSLEGIAVVGVDDSNGQWQYDATGGGAWVAFGAVSDASAVLLDTSAKIRFVPNVNYSGPSGNLTFRAWDQTSGANGDTGVDVSGNGGTTAFSAANMTASLTVNAVNSAPAATNDPGNFNTEVLALSPDGYWRLGESAGLTATDDGGTGNNGTYSGVTLGQPGAIAGDANTAASFDGLDDYIEIPHDNSYLLDNGTLQLWFNTADVTQRADLFSKDALGNGTGGHLSVYLDGTGNIEARLQSNSASYFLNSTLPLVNNQWHQVAVTFGAGGLQLYVDGQWQDSDAWTGGLGTTSGDVGNYEPIVIGSSTQVSGAGVVTPLQDYYSGLIDEVALFGTALTGEQIQNLYAAALQNYTVAEDTTLTVTAAEGVLINDSDAEGDPLTAVLVAGPSNAAAFTLNPDGSFSYTPATNFSGTDSFTYMANDGSADSNVATVTITVTPENDAPVADAGGPYTISEGDSVTLNAAASSDVDGDALTYEWDLNNDGTYGDVTGVGPTVDWATLQSFGITDDGVYTIGLRVSDGNGGVNTTMTTLNVQNTAPTLSATGAASILEGASYTLNLSAVDPGDDTVSSWIINWGDGHIETIAGNPPSVTHVYDEPGFTYNIAVSAFDEDGVFFDSALLVASAASGTDGYVLRYGYDPSTGAADLAGVQVLNTTNPADLDWAGDVIVGPDGYIYVTGYQSNNVVRFDAGTGLQDGAFEINTSRPVSIAFGPDGNLYIASDTGTVKCYDTASPATPVNTWTVSYTPEEMAFGPDGKLYIGDYVSPGIIYQHDLSDPVWTDDAMFTTGMPAASTRTEQFAFGPDGNLYVARLSGEILRFDGATGAYIDTFATPGMQGAGWPDGPTGVAFGPDGHLYVTRVDSVIRYDGTTGAYIDDFVPAGNGIVNPWFTTFTPNHQVYVQNSAPTLADGTLAGTFEDDPDPAGQSIATIFAGKFTDLNGSLHGVAVIGNPELAVEGAWQYSSDGGTSWYDIGTVADDATALVLDASTLIRFLPAANYAGAPADLLVRAVDNMYFGPYTDGATRVNIDAANNGDGTPLAAGSTTIATTISAVNDAPAARDDRIGLVFDGVDDYVTIGDYAGLNVTTNVTMEAWIRPTGLGTGTKIIVNKEGEYEMAINATTGEVMWAFDNIDPDWTWHYTGYFVQPNEWTHLAVTYDNGVINTYANGVLVETYNGSGAIADNYPAFNQLMIGGRENATTQRFDGQIDEVRIWNTTRTQLDIQSNMGAMLTGAEPGLIGNWRFDEGSGFTVQDRSVFGHHGTLADGVNAAEMPAWQGYLVSEEGTLNVNAANGVLANDYDLDGDPLTAVLVSGPANAASFTLNPDGSFSYTPAADFNGIDTFTYRANDGALDSNIATVTIRVTPVNDVPVATANTVTTTEDNAYTFSSADFTYTDVEGDALVSATITNLNLGGGTLTHSGGTAVNSGDTLTAAQLDTLVYTPPANTSGSPLAAFDFAVNDAGAGVVSAQMSIDVTAVNDVPVATANTVTTNEDAAYTFSAADFTYTDTEGDALVSATITNLNLAGGSLTHSGGTAVNNGDTLTAAQLDTLIYTPAANANGTPLATFDFTVNDAGTGVVAARMSIDVTAQPDPAVIGGTDTGSVTEDVDPDMNNLLEASGSLTIIDPDAGEALFNAGAIGGTYGVITLAANGDWSYAAINSQAPIQGLAAGATLTDTITVSSVDGTTHDIVITIMGTNDAPVAGNDVANVNEGGAVTIDVAATDSDIDNALDLNSIVITGLPANGSVIVNGDGTVTYTHDGSETLTDSFSYTISDVSGAVSNTAMVTLSVNPVNDPPAAANDSATVAEGGTVLIDLAANDSDVDNALDLNSIVITAAPVNGSLTVNADGTVSYTHDGSETTSDSFSYTINDASGAISNTATVTMTITPVNDAPTTSGIADVTVDEDAASTGIDLNAAFADADNSDSELAYAIVGNNNVGLFSLAGIDNTTGLLTLDYATDMNGLATISVRATDPSGSFVDTMFTVTVNAVNDNPVLQANSGMASPDGSPATIGSAELAVTDVDNSTTELVYTVTSLPANGELRLNGQVMALNGTFTQADLDNNRLSYVPSGAVTVDQFGFTVSDSAGGGIANNFFNILVQVAQENEDRTVAEPPPNDGMDEEEITEAESRETESSGLAGGAGGYGGGFIPFGGTSAPQQPRPALSIEPRPEPEPALEPAQERAPLEEEQEPVEIEAEPLDVTTFAAVQVKSIDALWTAIDKMKQEMAESEKGITTPAEFRAAAAKSTGVVLTAGVVAWVLRSGALLSSLLSTIPLWKGYDPLPILAYKDDDKKRKEKVIDEHRIPTSLEDLRRLKQLMQQSHNASKDGAIDALFGGSTTRE